MNGDIVMTNKPLYENIGIGTIIKRIGECNALVEDYNISIILTQQTPRESECKDLCITVGSKIIVIDFKAPDEISFAKRVYRNIKTQIKGLEALLGSDNLLLGFLHASLRITPQRQHANGYFLHLATPMTTIFVPLSQFTNHLYPSSSKVRLGNIIIRDVQYLCLPYRGTLRNIMSSEKNLILSSSVPSCYYKKSLFNINKLYPCCFIIDWLHENICIKLAWSNYYIPCISCGGLCKVNLDIIINHYLNNNGVLIKGYTLASLLWMMRCCDLGYYVRSEEERDRLLEHMLLREIQWKEQESKDEHVYILSYTPGIGFQIIPLNNFVI